MGGAGLGKRLSPAEGRVFHPAQGCRYQQYGFSLTEHERDATGTQKAKDLATSQSNRKRGRPKASKVHKLKLATPSGGNGKLSS